MLQTKVSALITDTGTDYSTEIKLNLAENRLRERGCTVADVEAALLSNKKFTMDVLGSTIVLKLAEESDAPTVITIRNKVLNTTVKGVPDIERVTLVQKDNEWVIQTTGSNLPKILEVEGIDKTQVRTNNVFEIANTLGIEAARNALINELRNTLEDQGLEVDLRYIMLVSDLMCSRGYMQQIGRHGIAGTKDSVLARAAFEITVPTIAHAAARRRDRAAKGRHGKRHRGQQHPHRQRDGRPCTCRRAKRTRSPPPRDAAHGRIPLAILYRWSVTAAGVRAAEPADPGPGVAAAGTADLGIPSRIRAFLDPEPGSIPYRRVSLAT